MLSGLPMWSKMSRLKIDELPMIRLHILLKEPSNREHIKFLKDSITNSLNKLGLKDNYEIWSYQDLLDNTHNVSFYVIILVLGGINSRSYLQCRHRNHYVYLFLQLEQFNDRQPLRVVQGDFSHEGNRMY